MQNTVRPKVVEMYLNILYGFSLYFINSKGVNEDQLAYANLERVEKRDFLGC